MEKFTSDVCLEMRGLQSEHNSWVKLQSNVALLMIDNEAPLSMVISKGRSLSENRSLFGSVNESRMWCSSHQTLIPLEHRGSWSFSRLA